jgi:hypothetical protein
MKPKSRNPFRSLSANVFLPIAVALSLGACAGAHAPSGAAGGDGSSATGSASRAGATTGQDLVPQPPAPLLVQPTVMKRGVNGVRPPRPMPGTTQ